MLSLKLAQSVFRKLMNVLCGVVYVMAPQLVVELLVKGLNLMRTLNLMCHSLFIAMRDMARLMSG